MERAAAVGAESSVKDDTALSKAASRVGRRRLAAQASLFDLANQRVVDELRQINLEGLSPEEARQFLIELQKRSI